ncbi:uncharacterized protein LOC108026443 [Drosophila biarmipes]|uniref:uncharacterized protein LOC108026443 n=1 Tax=Drosophila biarmipes TaxID=125945 RepID=UPI0007E6DADB|nr:uncharacterized protein LOC108026443 [Drosophila biarmipes]
MAEDGLNIPEWLNVQFITNVLSNHQKNPELQVTNLDLSAGSSVGDSYASVMFRAKVEYRTQKGTFSKSLIIKTATDMFATSSLFKTEIGMYKKVLPEFGKILRESKETSKLYAECLYSSLEPLQIVIFEDLVELGYAMVRNRQLSHEEICSAYSKLAKMHALSMKFINEQPEFLKEFKEGICLVDIPYMSFGIGPFTEFLGRIPELKQYQPYFEKIGLSFIERLREVMKEYQTNPQPGYYVLCHGDFHSRNVMFKHNKETGCLEDSILVDYQGCYVAPMAVDLMYSIYMLMDRDQRTGKFETLLNYYFSVLLETLRKIGYQGTMPTPLAFWAELKRLKEYEFLFLSTYLPMTTGLSLDNASNEGSDTKLEEFIEECKIMLARFKRSGYFEDL